MNVSDAYPIRVDYYRSLSGMIGAGSYNYHNEHINQRNFSLNGSGVDENKAALVSFDEPMESDQVLAALSERGLTPAPIEVLLALGEQHPDLQRQFPIIALGSIWENDNGRKDVVCLWGGSQGRRLFLQWYYYNWLPGYRFLVI